MLNVLTLFIFLSGRVEALEKGSVGIAYFDKIFGHLHRRPDVNSSTLTVLDCNTPLTVVADGKDRGNARWYYVKTGVHKGFVKKDNVSFAPVRCFQKRYPRFFESMKIDPGERYHWGKLYDRYEQVRTRVP